MNSYPAGRAPRYRGDRHRRERHALAQGYAGLYDWAVHHRLGGWQAMSWPAEIDVFLAVGTRPLHRLPRRWPPATVWPWATALTGLAVSIAGNVGHIQASPGHPVILADRLTAATSPIAAFAGLSVGLLVLKMTRQARPHAGSSPAVRAGTGGRPAAPRCPRERQPPLNGPARQTGETCRARHDGPA